MQYTTIFHRSKKGNIRMKKCDIFLNFAQNMDFGNTLVPTIYVLEQK